MRAFLLLSLLASPLIAGEEEAGLALLRKRMIEAKNRVFPTLVHIVNVEEVFAGGRRRRDVSAGSGFFVDAKGHIVTNFHVGGQAKQLFVTLGGKRKMRAELVAGDPYTDLAILRVDPAEAFPDGKPLFATFGRSAALEEGDFVMAMGSPLSLSRSVSFGIISCRDRLLSTMRLAGHETGKYNTWLQTDAAINPGNSGGPLVNLRGEVIGVNTRANLAADNIGYAIPSDVVVRVVQALLEHGTVPRAWLGLKLQPLDTLTDTAVSVTDEGVLVAGVSPASPAMRAGIKPGDLILELGGQPFTARFAEEVPALYQRVADLRVDMPVKLLIERDGKRRTLAAAPIALGKEVGAEAEVEEWGITVQAIPPRMFAQLGIDDGIGVTVTGISPGSPASRKLTPGDILREIDGVEVRDVATVLKLARESREKNAELVRVVFRNNQILDLTVLRPDYGDGEEGR